MPRRRWSEATHSGATSRAFTGPASPSITIAWGHRAYSSVLVETVLSSDPVVSSGAQAWPIQILRRITRITESLFDIISKVRR